MNKRVKIFIKEMEKKNYKLLTKVCEGYPMLTFAEMGIKDHWVNHIVQITADMLAIHQITAIDGFTNKTSIDWITTYVEKCREIAESEEQ